MRTLYFILASIIVIVMIVEYINYKIQEKKYRKMLFRGSHVPYKGRKYRIVYYNKNTDIIALSVDGTFTKVRFRDLGFIYRSILFG